MSIDRRRTSAGKRFVTTAFMIALAAGVAGCGTDRMSTGSVTRSSGKAVETMSAGELHGAAGALGQAYARNPNDKATALKYATVLQMNGADDQSLAGPLLEWIANLSGERG